MTVSQESVQGFPMSGWVVRRYTLRSPVVQCRRYNVTDALNCTRMNRSPLRCGSGVARIGLVVDSPPPLAVRVFERVEELLSSEILRQIFRSCRTLNAG